MTVGTLFAQYFPPKPKFTEKDVGDQTGKVFIITGGNSGCGLELAKLLYPTGATIYLACRSEQRATKAIDDIVSSAPAVQNANKLKFLQLDLNDLTTIKSSAQSFLNQESKLDVLWNNAGVGGLPKGTTTKQNIEGHVGINCVGPLMFTQELIPSLLAAAKASGTARVVWASSILSETNAAKNGGLDYKLMEKPTTTTMTADYVNSKVGNYFFAVEMARRYGKDNILSVAENPGNLRTNVWQHQSKALMFFVNPFLREQKWGGYTLLYSGLSPDITPENNGAYVYPFGYVHQHARADIRKAVEDGESTKRFWEWCESKYTPYL